MKFDIEHLHVIQLENRDFRKDRWSGSHTFLTNLNEILPYFLQFWSNSGKFYKALYKKTLPNLWKFPANQRSSKSYNLQKSINEFLSMLPKFLSDLMI